MLFYDTKQIEKEGFATIFQFIKSKLHTDTSISYPLLVAVLYTIMIPFLKYAIRILYTWVEKHAEDTILRIKKDGKVSIEKYVKLKTVYDERTAVLENIITQESNIQEQLGIANNENYTLRANISRYEAKENELLTRNNELALSFNKVFDISILNGYWTNTYTSTKYGSGKEDIFIDNGVYSVVDQKDNKRQVFNIINFHYNSITKEIAFIKERVGVAAPYNPTNGELKYNINKLILDNSKTMTGLENGVQIFRTAGFQTYNLTESFIIKMHYLCTPKFLGIN